MLAFLKGFSYLCDMPNEVLHLTSGTVMSQPSAQPVGGFFFSKNRPSSAFYAEKPKMSTKNPK